MAKIKKERVKRSFFKGDDNIASLSTKVNNDLLLIVKKQLLLLRNGLRTIFSKTVGYSMVVGRSAERAAYLHAAAHAAHTTTHTTTHTAAHASHAAHIAPPRLCLTNKSD